MEILIVLIRSVAVIGLNFLSFAMLLRAVMSWFITDENKFVNFLYTVTEPVIYPVRRLLEKMNWLQNTPIDFSFMITYMLIFLISLFIG